MRIILSILFVLACACSTVRAQDTVMTDREIATRPSFAIGVQAGFSTGTGIAFRYITNKRWAAEVVASYVSLERPFWSVGGELQFDLDRGEGGRVYALAGAGYYSSENTAGENGLADPVRLGLGVGYDLFLSSKIALGFELPITAFVGNGPFQVLPLPQLQFMFHFD